MTNLKVLIACEYSGVLRKAFNDVGIDALSVDLLETDYPGNHVVGDVIPYLESEWDLIIAHPPCTRLCNSGVRWLHERDLWEEMLEGAVFFEKCLRANAKYIAVENPVMHRHSRELIGVNYDFTCQPWEFGDKVKKRTCWWLKGLSPLTPTSELTSKDASPDIHTASPGKDRWKVRSKTFDGMAKAIVSQWGSFVSRNISN